MRDDPTERPERCPSCNSDLRSWVNRNCATGPGPWHSVSEVKPPAQDRDKPEFWHIVHGLLEPWQKVWAGDREKFDAEYPQWILDAAAELFAHDMCDAWAWNEYVSAAAVIITRHFNAQPPAALIERCAICGWPLQALPERGCVKGNCSQRPFPKRFYDFERACQEYKHEFGPEYRGPAQPSTAAGKCVNCENLADGHDGMCSACRMKFLQSGSQTAGSSEPRRYLGNSENLLVFSDNAAGSQPMPIDPSPTPWDFSTWGFYCDECRTFFDLVTQGRVETVPGNLCGYSTYWHKACNKQARYIGYDRSPVRATESAEQFSRSYRNGELADHSQPYAVWLGFAEAYAAELRTKAFAAGIAAGNERIRADKAETDLAASRKENFQLKSNNYSLRTHNVELTTRLSTLRESERNLREALEAFERYDQNLPPQFGHDCNWCQECFEKLGTMRRAALALAHSTKSGAEDNPSVSKEPHE